MIRMAHDEIAIVGVGCQFPGADNLDGFWRVLSKGENHVREIPQDRWDLDDVYDADPNVPRKTNVRQAGFMKDYHEWDHKLFGINEMEAGEVDPQQRMILDSVHMALEDGGIRRQDIDGSYTGVYIGSMNDDFKNQAMLDMDSASAYTMTGLHSSIISARVAYVYNLHGPAITMDTACSSSLVAINVAEQALRQGTCDAAICGGANSILDAVQFVGLSKTRMLSPTGQSKPFSADADGYARSEGCGIVILKRLKDALRDGNKVWATLTTGCNQDGNTATPITAPSGSMQIDLLQRLYDRSNVDKHSVQVIEAHGTGTPVGDPIETNALGKFFGKPKTSKQTTLIGSVKSNIGHTEAAAGVAGLTKVLLMMRHGQVVPSLLLDKANINPKIDFDQYGFDVPISVISWPKPLDGGRVACVNSFGFGGTNSHAIVHEYVSSQDADSINKVQTCHFPPFITLSALDSSSLTDQVVDFSQRLKNTDYDLRSVSYTSTSRRDHRLIRKAFFSDTQQDLIHACDKFIKSPTSQPQFRKAKVVFVFCGVGTAWQGMCNFMMRLDTFRDTIQKIDQLLLPLSGWTLSSKFSDGVDVTTDPLVSHVAIFGCQVGLVEVWKSLGICPDIVVGQSVGEVAAAYASGAIDLQSAVRVIYYRSKFLSDVKEGAMAVVKNYDTKKIEELCKATNGTLCVAVYINSTSCTISGDKESIDKVRAKLDGIGTPGTMVIDLDVTCAYHSSSVEYASKMLSQKLTQLTPGEQTIPIISTVTGQEEKHTSFVKGSYWERNTRCAVRFGDAIQHTRAISSAQKYVFLEIGPGPVLGAHMKTLFENQDSQIALPSMRKGSERPTLCNTICTVYEIGLTVKWEQLVSSLEPVSDIPVYVFRQTKTPFKTKQILTTTSTNCKQGRDHMYINDGVVGKKQFHIQVNETSAPFVYEHVVKGTILIPGAFYADIGIKIAETILGIPSGETIISLEFKKPARVEKGSETQIKVDIDASQHPEIQFLIRQDKSLICIGTVDTKRRDKGHTSDKDDFLCLKRQSFVEIQELDHRFDIDQLRLSMIADIKINMDSNAIYRSLSSMGFQHGRCFQIITEGLAKECQSLATFSIPEDVFKDIKRTFVHPCILDGMFQSTLLATDKEAVAIVAQENLSLIPVAIQALTVHKQPTTRTVYAYAKMTNSSILPNMLKLHYDILLLNTDGTVIVEVINFTTYCRRNTTLTPDELKYQLSWLPVSLKPCAPSTPPKILFINAHFQHRKCVNIVGKENIAVCELNTSQITEDLLPTEIDRSIRTKWSGIGEVDAFVLFSDGEQITSDIDRKVAERIYAAAKQNCMVITWLLRFFMNRKNVPLFVITENTQATDCNNSSGPNLIGCEVWGYIRNVLVEFVHDKVVLVDLQPSLEETMSPFFNFLASVLPAIESTQTDYVIRGNTVLGGTFNKSAMTEIMPSIKTSVHRPLATKGTVISKEENRIVRPFIIPLSESEELSVVHKDSVEIEVISVSLHDTSIFPTTASSPRRVNRSFCEGHPMIAVEYTGFEISSKSKRQFFRCGNNFVAAEDSHSAERWSVAAVCPQQLTTRTTVPRGCLVNLRKLPFYKPNMLTYSILFWHITNAIRKGSIVVIKSTSPHDEYTWLLEKMLKSVVSATVVHDETQTSPDTLVILGRYDETQLGIINHVTTVVALKYAISNEIRKYLRIRHDLGVVEIDTPGILSNEDVSRTLPKVIPWLKQNVSQNDTSRIQTMSVKHVCISDGVQHKLDLKLPLTDHFGAKAVFVITGGLTGLGWQTILLLAETGVGVVATISRREVDEETKKRIAATEKQYGCEIRCFRGDVCDLQAVTNMVDGLTTDYGCSRIKGIIHGAGVLESQLLLNVNESHFDKVMAPKILGAMNLHIASKHLPLDFFITQSSISSIMGMPGQGNYGAANSFMDVFARWRRSRGLAAQSINWGALEVGMAAQDQFVDNLVKRGFSLLTIPEIRSCFMHVMMQNATGVVYANLDWSKIAKDLSQPHMARVALTMKEVIKHKNVEHVKDLYKEENKDFIKGALKITNTDDATYKQDVEKFVEAVTRRTIGFDVDALTMKTTFVELGMESLGAVTFSNVVFGETGFRIATETLFNKSLGDIVAEICLHSHRDQSQSDVQTHRL